jgi:hypothetical protein
MITKKLQKHSGVSINLDHERFYTIINEQPEYKEGE